MGSLIPSSTGSNLPTDCEGIDETNPDYTKCFTWIARNIIRNSFFPRFNAIVNIQSTIIASQVTNTLRYLQDSETVTITAKDETRADPDSQLANTEYAVSDSDSVIDGSTGDAQAETSSQVNSINTTDASGSTVVPSSTTSAGFISVSLIISMIVALLF